MAPSFATSRHVDLPSSPSKKHRRTKSNILNPFAHAPSLHPSPVHYTHTHITEPTQHHAAPPRLPVLAFLPPLPAPNNASACISTPQNLAKSVNGPTSPVVDDFIRRTSSYGRILPRRISIDNLFSAKSRLSKSTSNTAHTSKIPSETNSSLAIHEAPSANADNFPSIRSLRTKFSLSLRPGTSILPAETRKRKESLARRHLRTASVTAKRLIPWAGDPGNDESRFADSDRRKDRKLSFSSFGIAGARGVQKPPQNSCLIMSTGYPKEDPSVLYEHIQTEVDLPPASGSTQLPSLTLLRLQTHTSPSFPHLEACPSDGPLCLIQDESAVRVPPSERSTMTEEVHLGNNEPREEAGVPPPELTGSSGLLARDGLVDRKNMSCEHLGVAICDHLSVANNEAVFKSPSWEKSAPFPRLAIDATPVQLDVRLPHNYADDHEEGSSPAANKTYSVSGDPLMTSLTDQAVAVDLLGDRSLVDAVEEQEGQGWWSTTKAKSEPPAQTAVGVAEAAQGTTRVTHVGKNVSDAEDTPIRISLDTQDRRIERLERLAAAPTRAQRSPRSAGSMDISARSRLNSVLAVSLSHIGRFSTDEAVAEVPCEPFASGDYDSHNPHGHHQLYPAKRQASVERPRPTQMSPVSRATKSPSPSCGNDSSFHRDDDRERWQNPRNPSVIQGPFNPYLADTRRWVFPPPTESDVASFRSGCTDRSSSPRDVSQYLGTPQSRQGSVMTSTSIATLRSKHALEKDSLIQALMLARNEIKMLREENTGLKELVADGIVDREEMKACLSDLRDEVERLQRLCTAEASDDETVALPKDVRFEEASTSSRQKHSSVSSSIFNDPPPDDMSMLVNAQMDIDNIFCSTPAPLQRSRLGVARFMTSNGNDGSPTASRSKVPDTDKRHHVPAPLQKKLSLGSTTATDNSNILSFAESSFSESEAGISWVLKLSEDDEAHLDDL